jgi:hypothetical protein
MKNQAGGATIKEIDGTMLNDLEYLDIVRMLFCSAIRPAPKTIFSKI